MKLKIRVKTLSLLKDSIIMGAAQIKEELYQFIEEGDTRLINMLYAVAREYTQEDYTLSGSPMSKDTLVSRVRAAKSRIKSGQFTTQEDLENEMKEW
jgi:hypothetical protein